MQLSQFNLFTFRSICNAGFSSCYKGHVPTPKVSCRHHLWQVLQPYHFWNVERAHFLRLKLRTQNVVLVLPEALIFWTNSKKCSGWRTSLLHLMIWSILFSLHFHLAGTRLDITDGYQSSGWAISSNQDTKAHLTVGSKKSSYPVWSWLQQSLNLTSEVTLRIIQLKHNCAW